MVTEFLYFVRTQGITCVLDLELGFNTQLFVFNPSSVSVVSGICSC